MTERADRRAPLHGRLAVISALLVAFSSVRAAAQGHQGLQDPATVTAQGIVNFLPRGAEFNLGNFPGEVLISVSVLGAVPRPGLYHVPKQTDLLRLLTLAGGVAPNADLEETVLKRGLGGKEVAMSIDLEALVSRIDVENPTLQTGDVIFVPVKEPLISPETSSVLAFVATMLSIITTAILLEDRLGSEK